MSVHFAMVPLALILTAVTPHIHSITFDYIIDKSALEFATICPFALSFTIPFSSHKGTFKHGTISLNLPAHAMFHVLNPSTKIASTVIVHISANTLGFVSHPFTQVDVPI
jgi:hypothetical protein